MTVYKIRRARMDELPILLQFEKGIIATERPFDETLEHGQFHYYDLASMIESNDAEVLVATVDDVPVASGNARILPAKPYNQFEKYAFLGFMYVLPEHRGKGVNKLIIKELADWARQKGLPEIRLQVYDENASAVKAYEKIGFRKLLTEMRLTTDSLL